MEQVNNQCVSEPICTSNCANCGCEFEVLGAVELSEIAGLHFEPLEPCDMIQLTTNV